MSAKGSTAIEFPAVTCALASAAAAASAWASLRACSAALSASARSRAGSQMNLSTANSTTARTSVTRMARFSRCPVCVLIDRLRSTSDSRLTPSGVSS